MNDIDGITKTKTKVDSAYKSDPVSELFGSLNKTLNKAWAGSFKKKTKKQTMQDLGMVD